MLPLSEGQMGQDSEPSQKQHSFRNRATSSLQSSPFCL
jgi:hypothetical protein